MGEVWDPIVEIRENITGPINAGTPVTTKGYQTASDEVLEVFAIEVTMPVDSTTGLYKTALVNVIAGGSQPVSTVNFFAPTMCPPEHPYNPGSSLFLGTPLLWRPITGIVPNVLDNTTLKVKPGDTAQVQVTPLVNLTSTDTITVSIKAARVKGASKFAEVVGVPSLAKQITLNGDLIANTVLPLSLNDFDKLPGGKSQDKPKVFPFITYAYNLNATTVNTPYEFSFAPTGGNVQYSWQELYWNLVNADRAYIIDYLAVHPHANSKSAMLYVYGRETNPEFVTRPFPEYNYFYPLMTTDPNINERLRNETPRKISPPKLFHKVKGGVVIKDNGTSIPANGVRVEVWGKYIEIK
jgi:hypothetical protein